jgi:ATP synthase F1 complex assembly factor 1
MRSLIVNSNRLEPLKTSAFADIMTSFRLQGFQSLLRGNSRLLRTPQRRWAQVHDVRFLASHHDPKYVQDKYRSKLDQKAKE